MICGSFRIISMPPVNTHFSRADCYFLFFRFQSPELCLTENQTDFMRVLNTPLKFRGGNNTPDFATGEKQTKIISPKAEQISPFWRYLDIFSEGFFISVSKLSKYCKKDCQSAFNFPTNMPHYDAVTIIQVSELTKLGIFPKMFLILLIFVISRGSKFHFQKSEPFLICR